MVPHRSRLVLVALATLISSAAPAAERLATRLARGDRIASLRVGADYAESLQEPIGIARALCARRGLSVAAGEMVIIAADVGERGNWTDVELAEPTEVGRCLSESLRNQSLPPPADWDWKQGPMPLALSLGQGVAEGQ